MTEDDYDDYFNGKVVANNQSICSVWLNHRATGYIFAMVSIESNSQLFLKS